MAPNRRGTQGGPALDCRDIHEYHKGLNDMLNRLLLYIGMACLLLAGGGGLACASDGFVIRGPESVVDGWVSTAGGHTFEDATLQLHGRPWAEYQRALLRFDLQAIDPVRHGQLKRAVLRLHATRVENMKSVPTVVSASSVAWNRDATFLSPDGKLRWPADRNRSENLDYAAVTSGQSRQVVTRPGTVEFDVTEIVEGWLFQGQPNYGFLLTMGSPIFGKPDAGAWTLEFASSEAEKHGLELIVELAGTPPTPEAAEQRALALYPSAALPPVKSPYAIVWYGASDKELWSRFTVSNMSTYASVPEWLAQRGVLDMTWGEGGPIDWLATEEAWEKYYLGIAASNRAYCMHEWHMASDTNDAKWAVRAARLAERKHPRCYSAFYYQGQKEMADLAAKGELDLLIQEGYTHVTKELPLAGFTVGMDGIKQRIDIARRTGAIEKHVVMLGHIAPADKYHPGHELTPALLDDQIRRLREYAPEMPGVGFYYEGGRDLALECDRLARKYFVDPAPDVEILSPAFEARLSKTATPHVTIRAAAQPKGERKVEKYRWFIDQRLVAETSTPQYVWDIRGEAAGSHFITVHAIDGGWNRAAAQNLVRCE